MTRRRLLICWIACAWLVLGLASACGSPKTNLLGSGGSGGSAAALTCNNSLDCTSSPNTVCDPASQTCVQCVTPADCRGTADCANHRCVPYTPCNNSLDCGLQVCDPAIHRCVDCVTRADCKTGEDCVANQCVLRVACQSDNTCTPLGQLCDKNLGYCVDCLQTSDCPNADHCRSGVCVVDVCQHGQSKCVGNALATCNAAGDGYDPAVSCPSRTTCAQEGSDAACKPWVCNAGQTYCDNETRVVCSPDGLSIVTSEDCAQTSQHCVAGQCSSLACTPDSKFCKNNQLLQCNSTGTSWSVLEKCTSTQVCDATSLTCKALLCTPNAPACNGSVATSCNATGTGYQAGGSDCAAQGKTCLNGVCESCPGGIGMVSDLRFKEVHVAADYVVVANVNSVCSADLAGVSLYGNSTMAPGVSFTMTFTSHKLGPGGTATIIDNSANGGPTPQTGDIVATPNLPFDASYGGVLILCTGTSCGSASSSNVIDLWAMAGSGEAPPPWSASITFTPAPLTGLTSSNEILNSYERAAYDGQNPHFLASDWVVGPASRPQ